MVITLLIAGRLSALSSVVLDAASTRVSAPLPAGQPPVAASALAALIASLRLQAPVTAMLAAPAAPGIANSAAAAAIARRRQRASMDDENLPNAFMTSSTGESNEGSSTRSPEWPIRNIRRKD
uniref:hypothetical protein n=1 Tax=Nevskia sp. TaxID=1929292 RepID=UPI0040367901